ncbi:MAG: FGGY family carbohydrate kinase [Christensenella sp.]|nr:FGGY family carbohydrate kinase [Christensenella sp.]
MRKKYVVGVDLGTTTIKAVFLDTQSNQIVSTQTEEIFPVKMQDAEHIEYNPKEWMEDTKRILARGFETGIDPHEVAGICFGGWTVMAFLVKADGSPVTNAIHYNDMRHLGLVEEANRYYGDLAVQRNGNYIGMYSGSVKQYWWKINHPGVFGAADYVATEVGYMNYMLTGQWTWNRVQAGFYSQYNAHTREWDDEIIEAMGFDRSMFPRLVDAWEVVGEVTPDGAAWSGLAPGTLVFGGVDDASPVALATGVFEKGQGFISTGSAANIAANTEEPVSHPTIITYPHCIPGLTMAITVMASTGLSYKWMRNTFGQLEAQLAQMTGANTYDYLNEQAKKAKPGAGGVLFLPYLDGDYTPNNDPNARGVFIGMGTDTTKGDMLRASLEGVAFSMLDNMMLIRQLGGGIDKIVLTGGLAQSPLWLQIIADITGCPVSLPKETEGAPFGSALIAAVGAGLYESFSQAVEKAVKIKHDAFIPDEKNQAIYGELYQVYKSLYPRLQQAFAEIADIKEKNKQE